MSIPQGTAHGQTQPGDLGSGHRNLPGTSVGISHPALCSPQRLWTHFFTPRCFFVPHGKCAVFSRVFWLKDGWGVSFGRRGLVAVLGCGRGVWGAPPGLNTPQPPQGWAVGSSSQGLPRCHDNCSIPAWQGWEIFIPSPGHGAGTGTGTSQSHGGATSSLLHSPPRAQGRAGEISAFHMGIFPFQSLPSPLICGVLARRASSRLSPHFPVYSGWDRVVSGLPDHGL